MDLVLSLFPGIGLLDRGFEAEGFAVVRGPDLLWGVVLRDLDYQTFFSQAGADFKIQVYYYDGAHGYDVQLAGMEAGWPFLRPGSFIVVDDFSYSDVMRAVNQFVANHIDRVSFHLVVATEATNPPDSTWWNGVVVLEVH